MIEIESIVRPIRTETVSGETVAVSATYPLPILTPLLSTILGDDTITIDSTTSMRIE